MSGFLLDTNCVSELVRVRPHPRVIEWMESVEEGLLYLSVLTLGEIQKGLATLAQGKRRTRLEEWLDVELRARFANRLLPVDEEVALRWGLLAALANRQGKPLSAIDGLLAATALSHDLTLVTRNIGDFAAAQVPVLNPWES